MKYKVTQIEFDFDDDEEFTQHHYDNITADTLVQPGMQMMKMI